MKNLMKRFIEDESGATMVEYAILVALVSVVAIAVLLVLGPMIVAAFQSVVDSMTGAGLTPAP